MKNKHEQLYVAVQDLLIGLGISPEELKAIALNERTCTAYQGTIITETAQKLIDADLIVEEINWRQPGNVFGPHQKTDKTNVSDSDQEVPKPESLDLLTFDAIKSRLLPQILWSYLQEAHSEFLLSKQRNKLLSEDKQTHRYTQDILLAFDKIKSNLPPGILWSYLRESHPDFVYEQIKDYLFPGC